MLLFPWLAMPLALPPFVKFLLVSLCAAPAGFLVGCWVSKPLKL